MFRTSHAVVAALTVVLIPTEAGAYAFAAARGSNGEVFEWCTKSSLSAAKSCAIDLCEDAGGNNCSVVKFCSDGKWSGVAEVRFTGDIRRHGSGCGFSRQTGENSIKSKMVSECKAVRKSIKPKADRCAATIINPDQSDTPNRYRWIWKDGGMIAQ